MGGMSLQTAIFLCLNQAFKGVCHFRYFNYLLSFLLNEGQHLHSVCSTLGFLMGNAQKERNKVLSTQVRLSQLGPPLCTE